MPCLYYSPDSYRIPQPSWNQVVLTFHRPFLCLRTVTAHINILYIISTLIISLRANDSKLLSLTMKRHLPMTTWFAAALIPGCVLFLLTDKCHAQKQKSAGSKPVVHFDFDGEIGGLPSKQASQQYSFTKGIDKNALQLRPRGKSSVALPSGTFQS